jgi:hypothetical protein
MVLAGLGRVRLKAPYKVSGYSVAGKLGPFQAVKYRARRVPLRRQLRQNIDKLQNTTSVDCSIIITNLRVP